MFRRRAKSLVGLDIGSSAVKAVELKPAGKGYKVVASAPSPFRPTASSTARSSTAPPSRPPSGGCSTARRIKTKEVAASLSGNAVIVKKISLPVMTEAELAESIYWEAEQYIPFDIQDVNLDYQILDTARPRRQDDDGRPAGRGEEREDRRLHRRHRARPGGRAVVVDVDAFALQNAYEVNYGTDPAPSSCCSTPAPARPTSTSSGRPVGLHPRHLDWRQRLHRGAPARAEPAVRAGRPAEARPRRRRRDLRGRPSGAARGDRERDARDSEDLRLLQGDRRLRPDRSDRDQRRGVARRGLRRDARRALRGAGRAFDPFKTIAFDAAKFQVDAADVAPTAAVAVGLALRRAGDR